MQALKKKDMTAKEIADLDKELKAQRKLKKIENIDKHRIKIPVWGPLLGSFLKAIGFVLVYKLANCCPRDLFFIVHDPGLNCIFQGFGNFGPFWAIPESRRLDFELKLFQFQPNSIRIDEH